jgi:hypothetical protein
VLPHVVIVALVKQQVHGGGPVWFWSAIGDAAGRWLAWRCWQQGKEEDSKKQQQQRPCGTPLSSSLEHFCPGWKWHRHMSTCFLFDDWCSLGHCIKPSFATLRNSVLVTAR